MIYANSCTLPVFLRPKENRPPDPSTIKALTRIIGPRTELNGEIQGLAKALENGTLQGALDGSVKNKQGTGAWIIEPETYQKQSPHSIRGAGPVDGDPEFLHST